MLVITNDQINANQNPDDTSPQISQDDNYKEKKKISVGEDMEKWNPCLLLVEIKNSAVTVGNNMEFPKKLFKRTTVRSINPTSRFLAEAFFFFYSKSFNLLFLLCGMFFLQVFMWLLLSLFSGLHQMVPFETCFSSLLLFVFCLCPRHWLDRTYGNLKFYGTCLFIFCLPQ